MSRTLGAVGLRIQWDIASGRRGRGDFLVRHVCARRVWGGDSEAGVCWDPVRLVASARRTEAVTKARDGVEKVSSGHWPRSIL